jgi:predicted alpha-1,6-mannanase (GH76 family)
VTAGTGAIPAAWAERAEWMQEKLYQNYWDPETRIMRQWFPGNEEQSGANFYYWWQAHVIDSWMDAFERTQDPKWMRRVMDLAAGLRKYNGDTFRHNYYDDMEWTALALLRVYDATGREDLRADVLDLWCDIRTAWNGHLGGGMAWKKDQLDYKNTPANAPAAILAARLFLRFGEEADLAWAIRIYRWNRENLVDPHTGLVWDGINRLGDGHIDKDWEFTYCQGVIIGAALELFKCTGDPLYLADGEKTAKAAYDRFVSPGSGMLPDEGIDDTGLFKGIFVRYMTNFMRETGASGPWRQALARNGNTLWSSGMDREHGVVGPSWETKAVLPVQVSVQLSGVMLIEALAKLEK